MKKLLIALLSLTAVLSCALGLAACKDGETSDVNNGVQTVEQAYAKATELGYSGTLDEFIILISGKDGEDGKDGADGLNGINGKDGIGIKSARVDGDGFLIIVLSDNSIINCGKVVGADGKDGADGEDGKDGEDGSDGKDATACIHNFTQGESVAPTCTSIGYESTTCTKCGYTEYSFKEALGHSFKEGYTLTEASCTEEGLSFEFCSKCGTVKAVTTPREPHSYVDGICTVCQRSVYSEGLEYVLNEDGASYSVNGMGTCTDSEIGIPATYEGLPVTCISSKAFNGYFHTITSVLIPASITKIGNRAFGNTYIKNVYYLGDIADWCAITFEESNSLFSKCENFYVNNQLVTELVIPGTVEQINDYAFIFLKSITSITISEGVKSIGVRAFYWCRNVTDLVISDSVTSIGIFAFAHQGIESLTIPAGVENFGDCAFSTCTNLSNLTLSEGLTSIGDKLFYGCRNLTSVTIPKSLTTIGEHAFMSCKAITAVNYLGTVADWCNMNFGNYYSNPLYQNEWALLYIGGKAVTQLVIPEGVTEVKDYAFYGYYGIKQLVIASSVETISTNAFISCYNLESVMLFEGVTEIDEYAFSGCANLASINIPASVTSIGEWAFNGCTNLNSVTFADKEGWHRSVQLLSGESVDDGEKDISAEDLADASKAAKLLKEFYVLRFTDGYTHRGYLWTKGNDFIYTEGMQYTLSADGSYYILSGRNFTEVQTNIVIPPGYNGKPVKEIGYAVFNGCSYVKDLTLPDTIIKIGNNAFSDCGITKLNIPASLVDIGDSAFRRCRMLTEITVDKDNPVYHSSGNCLINTADKKLIIGSNKSTIPADGSVEIIGKEAFCGLKGFSTITIPKSVKAIESQAFNMCEGLQTITIPKSVTTIGSSYVAGYDVTAPIGFSPFMGCTNLSEIIIEEGNPRYHSEGNCIIETALKLLVVGCKTSIIPTDGSVTAIYSWAFSDIETLTEISIPNTVTKIYTRAFDGCSGLKKIYIPESVIEIEDVAFSFCKSLERIEVSESNPFYSVKGNCLIDTENKTIIVGCKSSIIPDDGSVTDIGVYAFAGLDLTTIKIPVNIVALNGNCLAYNYNLKLIEYEGAIEQWNSIAKSNSWNFHLGLYTGCTVHCADGDVE